MNRLNQQSRISWQRTYPSSIQTDESLAELLRRKEAAMRQYLAEVQAGNLSLLERKIREGELDALVDKIIPLQAKKIAEEVRGLRS